MFFLGRFALYIFFSRLYSCSAYAGLTQRTFRRSTPPRLGDLIYTEIYIERTRGDHLFFFECDQACLAIQQKKVYLHILRSSKFYFHYTEEEKKYILFISFSSLSLCFFCFEFIFSILFFSTTKKFYHYILFFFFALDSNLRIYEKYK